MRLGVSFFHHVRSATRVLVWAAVGSLGWAQTPVIGAEGNVQWAEVGGDRLIFTRGGATSRDDVPPWRVISVQRRLALPDLALPKVPGSARLSVGRESVEVVMSATEVIEGVEWARMTHYGMALEDLRDGRRAWTLRGTFQSRQPYLQILALDDAHLLVFRAGGMAWPTPKEVALWVVLRRGQNGRYEGIRGGDWPTMRSPYIVTGPNRWRYRYPGLTSAPLMTVPTPDHVVLISPQSGHLMVFDRRKGDLVGTQMVSSGVDESWYDRWNAFNPLFFAKATPEGGVLLGTRPDAEMARARAYELEHRDSPQGMQANVHDLFPRVEWRELTFNPLRVIPVTLPGNADMLSNGPAVERLSHGGVPWLDGRLLHGSWDPDDAIIKALNPPKVEPAKPGVTPTEAKR